MLTDDELIKIIEKHDVCGEYGSPLLLARAVEQATAKRCAEVADELPPRFTSGSGDYSVGYNEACSECAKVIRDEFKL
jgi:hypothetical protein